MIFNCWGSNGEDQGQQHPEAPTQALPPSTTPGLVGIGRGRVLGRGQGARQQVLGVFYLIYLFLVSGVVVFSYLSLTYNT